MQNSCWQPHQEEVIALNRKLYENRRFLKCQEGCFDAKAKRKIQEMQNHKKFRILTSWVLI